MFLASPQLLEMVFCFCVLWAFLVSFQIFKDFQF